MKSYTVAVLGCGNRGFVYANEMQKHPEQFKIVSVCDTNPKQIDKFKDHFSLSPEMVFSKEADFFREKRADLLIVATWDKDHVKECLRGLRLGYDVLLEKPISDDRGEILDLIRVQKETGKKVVVCHVLRYSTGIVLLDRIVQSGVLGRILAIDHTERVNYWHWAQAYVRLHSQWKNKTHPTILAKCCHDLDLIQHYANSKCETVSSVGGLRLFNRKSAPKGATEFCADCPHANDCPYSAKKIYVERWKNAGCPAFSWPWNKVSLKSPNTEEDLLEGLKSTTFGKCVFLLDVEKDIHVVDHQLVQMKFQNGVTASLKMVAAGEAGRRIDLFGTHGEVLLDALNDTVEIKPYGGKKEILRISDTAKETSGHGGGDAGLISDLYRILIGEKTDYTSLEESLESHLMGIAAEESRLHGGEIQVHPESDS